MNQAKHIVVDICWTLFYSNTTFDFLDFTIEDKRYRCLRRFFRTRLGHLMNLALYRITHWDCERTLCIRFLKGYSRAQLKASAERFYTQYLCPRKIEPVWEQVAQARKEGKTLILVSGTLDCVADVVAEQLGAQRSFASTLEYKHECATGRFSDFLLTKEEVLHRLGDFDIITDNLTDLALIRRAQSVTIICYNNRTRWDKHLPASVHPHYIDASESRY